MRNSLLAKQNIISIRQEDNRNIYKYMMLSTVKK